MKKISATVLFSIITVILTVVMVFFHQTFFPHTWTESAFFFPSVYGLQFALLMGGFQILAILKTRQQEWVTGAILIVGMLKMFAVMICTLVAVYTTEKLTLEWAILLLGGYLVYLLTWAIGASKIVNS
jgi:hypothetical protein